MKRFSLLALSTLAATCFCAGQSMAQDRVTINTPNGEQSCLFENNTFTDCVPVDDLRYEVETPDGIMHCKWQNGSYTDCVRPDSQAAQEPEPEPQVMRSFKNFDGATMTCIDNNGVLEGCLASEGVSTETNSWLDEHGQTVRCSWIEGNTFNCASPNTVPEDQSPRAAAPRPKEPEPEVAVAPVVQTVPDPQPAPQPTEQPQQTAAPAQASTSSSSSFGYWDNDYDIPNGMTWGVTLGWFGHVYEGKTTENAFSFGGNIGFKYDHFGLSLDIDLSMAPTDKKFHDLWTYSFTGLAMFHLPITYGIMQTIGFGVGYTAWSLDYEYTSGSLHWNWYTGYYIKEEDHSKTVDDGGWFSLKLKTRLDIVADDILIGLEFVWIPWLDLDNHGKIVNNLIGLQFLVGGIVGSN